MVLCRRAANEKLEQIKQVQKEVDEAEEDSYKLENERGSKVGHFSQCCADKVVHMFVTFMYGRSCLHPRPVDQH